MYMLMLVCQLPPIKTCWNLEINVGLNVCINSEITDLFTAVLFQYVTMEFIYVLHHLCKTVFCRFLREVLHILNLFSGI